MSNDKKKIVIVGAGMAGLTAAAYLTRQNYNVLLLEKNDRYGGLLHTFDYDGFSFDSGPRAFINSGIVKPIFKDLGIDCDFLENKISIGIEDQMVRVNSLESLQEYKRIMLQLYPEKTADIEKIFSYMYKLSEHTKVLYEFDNPNFGDIMSDKKFVVKKLLPWTFKFLNALRNFNKFSMPMEKFMQSLTDSQPIIDVLTQFFFRMTPTYFALGYFYVYLDYFYPKTGTIALPKLLAQKIQQGGGTIQLNTRVAAVDPSTSTVTDAEGRQYGYDHLIWAADLKTLYRTVNTAGLDSKTAQSIAAETRRVLAAKGAESVCILFLGVDRPLSYFQARGGEHLFYTPSRKGLGETNQAARENLLQNFEQKSREEIFAWLDDFCRYNTFEVSIPALRDPDLAPEGKTGVMISCLFDYAMYEKIQKAGFYDEFKKTMEDKIINIFSETLYQGFADDVLFRFSATPLTIREAIGSSEGAITGWSFETPPPVVNKLTELAKSARTPIPGVLQAGQWAYAPAGVPIAMMTGWYAVQEIIKQSKK